MTAAELVTAYDAGVAAGERAEVVTACPYAGGTVHRTLWLRGYTAGRIAAARA